MLKEGPYSITNPYSIINSRFLFQGPRSSGASSVLGSRQEERVSLTLPGFDDEDDDDDDIDEDKISDNEVSSGSCSSQTYIVSLNNQTFSFFQPSPRGSDRLLKNLHLDLDALGGGLQYEVII